VVMDNDERRREWLRALRQFKIGMRVRAKIGVLETLCQQIAAERRNARTWDAPAWDHDRWLDLLYQSIRNNEFPPELVLGFVKTAEVTFFNPNRQPDSAGVLDAVDLVCKRQSRALRERFGVRPRCITDERKAT
jgi:hypothetical protein